MSTSTDTELAPASGDLARHNSLWSLDVELQRLMEQAKLEEELGGNVKLETMDALRSYFEAALQKVDNIAGWMKAQEAYIGDVETEIKRLQQFVAPEKNALARCKRMLQEFMAARGITQIKGRLNKITLANNGGQLPMKPIADPSLIPPDYQMVRVVMTQREWAALNARAKEVEEFLDERSIGEALRSGFAVTGAELGERGQHIRVR